MAFRRSTGLLVALLAAAVVTAMTVERTDLPAGPQPSGPLITLVTGDQVRIDAERGLVPVPAPGREHINFAIWTDENGHRHVLPDDAAAAYAAGKLDPRLFDIDDTWRTQRELHLSVDYPGAAPTTVSVKRTPEFWAQARRAERIWLVPGAGRFVLVGDPNVEMVMLP